MKFLVVNADDFGASNGVNRGIVEAHERGIVTSASLMVAMPASEEAARLARRCPSLSVGLHVELSDADACKVSLELQVRRFIELLDRPPTHLDSHHNVHAEAGLRSRFQEVAEQYGIPLRACSGVRYCGRFYGQWDGESHPEQIEVGALIEILETDVRDAATELCCHPGYVGPDLVSSYRVERELELRTLCDEHLRRFLDDHDIALVGFVEAAQLLAHSAP